ncbi:MAG TPA: PTS fructose-like transporter subunit EIIC [Phycisphaerales bacterium]|nr:PTS fructose-like transporter subunit EIIC [Phycisphaerales bacterium]
MKQVIQELKQYLLSGVSFAIPFIASGGILIAVAIAFAPMGETGPDFSNSPVLAHILSIGEAAFTLLLPVLAGYISYAIAGKPGLVAGFVGGYFASLPHEVAGRSANAGFLGALLAGLAAGYMVRWIKRLPVHKLLRPIMPILIIPILSALAIGTLMFFVSLPIANIMVSLDTWLRSMQASGSVALAMVLGAMIAFDMGGPVNKTAFFFGASMIEQGNYLVMGAVAAAICTPPLGMGLATFLSRRLWTEEQRESGIAAFGMGMIGITEGAIPFAAAEPIKVIPCIMAGSMTASVIAMLGGVGGHAPHGGPIVLPVVDHRFMYVVAIIAGTAVTALAINALKTFTANARESNV